MGRSYERWITSVHEHEDVSFFNKEFLPKHSHKIKGRVLEIGAGMCWASSMVKLKFPSVMMIASDISNLALQEGRRVCLMLNSNVDHFVACDVERLPFKDQTFTTIFGMSVIHHLLNPHHGVAEVCRVLEKGGVYFGLDFGLGQMVANRIQKALFKSRFWPYGAAERAFGITEIIPTFNEWEDMYYSLGFRNVKLTLERRYVTPPFRFNHKVHQLIPIYRKIVSTLPDRFIRLFFGSGICITATK